MISAQFSKNLYGIPAYKYVNCDFFRSLQSHSLDLAGQQAASWTVSLCFSKQTVFCKQNIRKALNTCPNLSGICFSKTILGIGSQGLESLLNYSIHFSFVRKDLALGNDLCPISLSLLLLSL